MIFHTSLQKLGQNINQRLNPQKTPHTSPWRARYGVSFVNVLEKNDRVITAPHCTISLTFNGYDDPRKYRHNVMFASSKKIKHSFSGQLRIRSVGLSQPITKNWQTAVVVRHMWVILQKPKWMSIIIMTSSNGNIFRVTGPLCGVFTGHRWIPITKVSDAGLCCFLWSAPE